MPPGGNLLRAQDADILRQPLVHRKTDFLRGDPAFGVEYGHVSQGVNAGIRTAGPEDADRLF